MHERSSATTTIPAPGRDVLTEILRDGAQRLLGQAIEAEVEEWTARHAQLRDERGRQQVVRNGHQPTRTLVTGVGAVEVTQPRVLDRRIIAKNADGPSQVVGDQPVFGTTGGGFDWRWIMATVGIAIIVVLLLRRSTAHGRRDLSSLRARREAPVSLADDLADWAEREVPQKDDTDDR